MAVVPRTKAAAQNNLAAIAAIPLVFVIKIILAYRVIYPIRFRQADAGLLTCLFHLVGDRQNERTTITYVIPRQQNSGG